MGAVRIRHSIREFATQPVILWILLGGTTKWLPLNFGFNDVMHTAPIGSLTSLDACNSGAFADRGKPISLHQAVLCIDVIPADQEVSKCNQSRWPSEWTGSHGYYVTRNSSVHKTELS